jgi:F-type H+-transporting ATPase subunit b
MRTLAQEHVPPAAAGQSSAAAAEHGTESHGESWGAVVSRLANFAILVAGLWYLLRSPLGQHLERRSEEIRDGLENAAEMKARAAAQVAQIEARMRELPVELEALRKRGAEEIRTEESRIRRAAEEERARLLDQMRRQIDLQLQAARRDLRREGAELAVQVARKQLAAAMNDADQRRLISRYISQVQGVA